MIRCHIEVTEDVADKKHEDSRELPLMVLSRATFEQLLGRDGAKWEQVASADELKTVASRVQRELVAGHYQRFADWATATLGAGMARAAGLPIAPLRLSLAS